MNHSAYIFGDLGSGYTQYPDDFTKSNYKGIVNSTNVTTQIAIQRDGNLVYYIYHRRLTSPDREKTYIGIAICFNEVYCRDIKQLFSLFEDTITNLVVTGKILEFTDDGNVTAKSIRLPQSNVEVERIMLTLSTAIDKIPENTFQQLPALNYGIGKNELIQLPSTASNEDIDNNIQLYNLILVLKDEDFDSQELSGYAGKIRNFNQQINKLTQNNSELSTELAKVRRQKKRTTIVTVLSVLITIVVIIFISVGKSLSEQVSGLKTDVHSLKEDVEEKDHTIDNHLLTIKSYSDENKSLKDKLNEKQQSLQNAEEQIISLQSNKSDLERQMVSLKKQLSSKSLEFTNLKKEVSTIEAERDRYNKWYTEKLNETKRMQDKISSLEARINELLNEAKRKRR